MKASTIIPLILMLVLMAAAAQAKDLSVEKLAKEKDLKTGDSVTISLMFTNPFDQDLPVRIVDNNVIANNGLDVQCMEFTVPANQQVEAEYPPIQLLNDGEYTLDAASVSYTDPETGEENTVKSGTLKVSVGKGNAAGSGQGVTTIYQCDGMNMRSTSFSSTGGNMQVSINQGGMQAQIQQQMQQMEDDMNNGMQNAQDRMQQQNAVQNNQIAQDAGALKQQMEEQREQYQQMQQEFAKQLGQDEQFAKEHQQLMNEGYNLTDAQLDPESNSTGSFKMQYQRSDGETASLSGDMKDGKMQDLDKQSSVEQKRMAQQMMQDPQYKQYAQQLAQQGYNQTAMKMSGSGNMTQLTARFENPDGQQANITAEFENKTITKVEMKKEDEKSRWWIPAIILALAGITIAAYLIYRKYHRQAEEPAKVKKKVERPIDYHKDAKKLLEEAKRLFADGKEKDAYEKASQSIRLFYTHKLGHRKELTNTQTIEALKRHKMAHHDTQRCLNLCGMVEFAKYKANKKDFSEIVRTAEKIIEMKK